MQNDTIADAEDNCPQTANTNQSDRDNDGMGDLCDNDIDNDGLVNASDNCQNIQNENQNDFDGNGVGDVCDSHTYSRLNHPESVVRYNNYYFVSNLGVQLLPDTADGDGHIAVINTDGSGLIQNFITGLDSPKGLKIIKNELYVCDLSVLKVFQPATGEMIRSYDFSDVGVSLLNAISDLDLDEETVYITATRTNRIFKLNVLNGVKEELLVTGVSLNQTNGIELDKTNNRLFMAEFGNNNGENARIIEIDLVTNEGKILGRGITGTLYDGIVLLENTLYLSDWSHRLFSLDLTNENAQPQVLRTNLSGPADIIYDSEFNRIVIPSMQEHQINFHPL